MRRTVCASLCLWLLVNAVPGAEREREYDFSALRIGQTPTNTLSTLGGGTPGVPGRWEIVADEVETAFPSVTGVTSAAARRNVLAQTSRDTTEERFPLLIFNDEVFDDFTASVRVKLVDGQVDQMAGLAFRVQDERNYYAVRASASGNTFRFYKVVDGSRSAPLGPEIAVPAGVWHELSVECRANRIQCRLNGQPLIPELTDTSFTKGRLGLWTKSDSVSYFADLRIGYRQRQTKAEQFVAETTNRFARLLGVHLFGRAATGQPVVSLAGAGSTGQTADSDTVVLDVIERGSVYFAKVDGQSVVTLPLRDRNGDPIAAVRVVARSFKGQTEANAIAVAMPVVELMKGRAQSYQDLVE